MNKLKVSACIVTYNCKEKVLKAISSLIEHTIGVDLTIYVSDNNSTDGTVSSIKKHFPSVLIIKNDINGGYGYGHNKILDLIDSKYHVIVNPDIMVESDVITKLSIYMENNPDVGLVTPKILNLDKTIQHLPKKNPKFIYLVGSRIPLLKKYRTEYTMSDKELTTPVDIEFCTGCFMFIKTSLFKEINGFDDRYFMYFEDADLTRNVLKTNRVIYFPDTYVIHEWERSGAKKLKYFIIQIISMFKYFKKWR